MAEVFIAENGCADNFRGAGLRRAVGASVGEFLQLPPGLDGEVLHLGLLPCAHGHPCGRGGRRPSTDRRTGLSLRLRAQRRDQAWGCWMGWVDRHRMTPCGSSAARHELVESGLREAAHVGLVGADG